MGPACPPACWPLPPGLPWRSTGPGIQLASPQPRPPCWLRSSTATASVWTLRQGGRGPGTQTSALCHSASNASVQTLEPAKAMGRGLEWGGGGATLFASLSWLLAGPGQGTSAMLLQEAGGRQVGLGTDFSLISPDSCQWSPWGPWSRCQVPCSGGFRLRWREAGGPPGGGCQGPWAQTESCNMGPCPGNWVWASRGGAWTVAAHMAPEGTLPQFLEVHRGRKVGDSRTSRPGFLPSGPQERAARLGTPCPPLTVPTSAQEAVPISGTVCSVCRDRAAQVPGSSGEACARFAASCSQRACDPGPADCWLMSYRAARWTLGLPAATGWGSCLA